MLGRYNLLRMAGTPLGRPGTQTVGNFLPLKAHLAQSLLAFWRLLKTACLKWDFIHSIFIILHWFGDDFSFCFVLLRFYLSVSGLFGAVEMQNINLNK